MIRLSRRKESTKASQKEKNCGQNCSVYQIILLQALLKMVYSLIDISMGI
nr:MAG TPA: hypothetical protein [Caudoviricetes sp.]